MKNSDFTIVWCLKGFENNFVKKIWGMIVKLKNLLRFVHI